MSAPKRFDDLSFDKDGFNKDGFDRDGFNRQGYNDRGFDRLGIYSRGGLMDLNGNNAKQAYIGKWECCGNPSLKEGNPTPYKHAVPGKDGEAKCDIHNHVSCIGDPNGCRRLYDSGLERPKQITPYSDSSAMNQTFGK